MEQLLTTREVAELLQVHVNTVYQYIKQGKLVPRRVGGMFRFTKGDIDKFIGGNNEVHPPLGN